MSQSLKQIIEGRAKDLGDNFVVRRTLPHLKQRSVGPFIFWDHMGPTTITPQKEMVVRAHPHIGLSTITYLFKGQIMHRDSLGNEVPIKPGEVNWMTSGKGISHSERSKVENEHLPLEGIQLWVALPKESEDVDPSFVHYKETELPLLENEGFQLRLIAGEALGEKSPLPVFSKLFYLNGKSHGPANYSLPVPEGQESALYVIEGEMLVDGKALSQYQMAVFNDGQPLQLQTTKACEFMILGGETFPEKRHLWWNFVSHDPEKIEAAKKRWLNDDFGTVINETERIPLPEK